MDRVRTAGHRRSVPVRQLPATYRPVTRPQTRHVPDLHASANRPSLRTGASSLPRRFMPLRHNPANETCRQPHVQRLHGRCVPPRHAGGCWARPSGTVKGPSGATERCRHKSPTRRYGSSIGKPMTGAYRSDHVAPGYPGRPSSEGAGGSASAPGSPPPVQGAAPQGAAPFMDAPWMHHFQSTNY